jgi:hypothetical protein
MPLKWRRLIRFVISPVIIFFLAVGNGDGLDQLGIVINAPDEVRIFIFVASSLLLAFLELAFISWLLKPFVVKEK